MNQSVKPFGHVVKFKKGLFGLFKRGWWEIPDVMAASFMAIVGAGMATYGVMRYIETGGENSEYKSVYYVVRSGDPRACKLKNPTYSEYNC
ncbi:hypothetical protein HW555_011120 [Spodoptera exigua]|uniref:Uncharacterized protein n=1 Tax=Spodoptera exigua TaxID=7107 RepID=A0A835G891_SPOEX|nr:hypothetical protein HW555_011120 [Spodoptera exigua]KAH9634455.1 hypothetical protein HF086_008289 [Spodoptera exigua]